MDAACRIEMLGGLRAEQAGRSITRFRTYKTGVLLAYLAFYGDKAHPREMLTELLWPECDPESGRNSLSKSLGSLRNQLEPPGVPSGAVITADRASIRLNPLTCTTDVAAFSAAVLAARNTRNTPDETMSALAEAADLYRGELLPALYEDWNIAERAHLGETYLDVLQRLTILLEHAGDRRRAREYARRAVTADPLREETHHTLVRLSLSDDDPAAALRQYREWERLSQKELGSGPSPELRALVAPWLETAPVAVPTALALPQESAPAFPLGITAAQAGTVTLLLGEAAGPEMIAMMEPVVRRHGGVFSSEGESTSLAMVFPRATEAASCAVSLQSSVKPHAQRRLALHTGEVGAAGLRGLLDEGVRTLHAAHPGQILCSEATSVLLRRDPEPGLQIMDLGLFHLPGGGAAERLADVYYPGRPLTVPARPAAASAKTLLPLQVTRFFGREDDLAQMVGSVERAKAGDWPRLWTLTGPGGMGKTRLSLEIARESMTAFAGAVGFVPLAEIRDPGLIVNAIAEALPIRSPVLDPFAEVVRALSERPTLLVLDNFEQLAGPAAPDLEAVQIVQNLLERVPSLVCLVTSRHRLGVIGEREFPLSPLPTPDGAAPPEALAACESVRLFIDRAQAVRPDFQLTPGNAVAVAHLCERLEGLPLAIELAAARAQVLTPAQMLKQLERRFDFLVSRQRNFALRHRTIRAAIDWSYGLLTPELHLFAGLLSVFRGGWTLAAAEAVTGEALALDFLEQLVDCSLILPVADGTSGEMRYRQLETLRQYAEETLTPDQKAAQRARHADHFLALAEDAGANLQGPEQGEWLARLEADHDNLRAALHWCLEPGHVGAGLRAAGALWRFWHVRGHVTEGREQITRLMTAGRDHADAGVFGQAQVAAGILARYQNDAQVARELLVPGLSTARDRGNHTTVALALYHLALVEVSQNNWGAGRALLEESLSLCRTHGDRSGIAAALSSLAIVESEAGEFVTARALFLEALALRRMLGDKQGIATLLYNLGNVALLQTDYDQARTLFEESLILRRELADKWGIASLLNSLGLILSNQKEYDAARPLLEESLGLFRDLGDKSGIAVALCNLGTVALMLGDSRARELLSDSLALRWRIGDKLGVAFALEALAQLEVAAGDAPRAVTLWAVTQSLREAIGAPLPPANRTTVEHAVASARGAMAGDAFTAAWAHGRGLELAQALALVLDNPPFEK